MVQHKLVSPDFSKCHCESPGFCPIFGRTMGTHPPDWQWCQKTCLEDRESYFSILSKEGKTENHKLTSFFRKLKDQNINPRLYLFYYLTMSEKYHLCQKAQEYQKNKNKEIVQYIESRTRFKNFPEDIRILSLGHSKKQFDSINDRSYLKKVNLNDIDCGKYSDNKWAEARAYIASDELLGPAKFVGFTTASWNLKYEPYSRIDEFHNWETSYILLNSKPEDKIVLCADIFCPCIWFDKQENVLSVFFGKHYAEVGKIFFDIFGYYVNKHHRVPFSNQMILHRHNYETYKTYLISNDIFEKINYFVNKTKKFMRTNEEVKYSFNRLHGYVTEMISTFWFLNQDFIYLPNAERRQLWYDHANVKERSTKWGSTTF